MSRPTVAEVLGEAGWLLLGFLAAIVTVELVAGFYMEFI